MVVIQYKSGDDHFTLNGQQYPRIYQAVTLGFDSVGIFNIYDTRLQLLGTTSYKEIKVNGSISASQNALIDVLVPILYEGTGAFYFLPIGQNQYGTHPAFRSQAELNEYLLNGGVTNPTEPTDPNQESGDGIIDIASPTSGSSFTEGETITITTEAVDSTDIGGGIPEPDGTFYSDIINTAINDPSEATINIGTSGVSETYLLDTPIFITEPNKTINIYANLRVKDGTVRALTADVNAGDTVIPVANADKYFRVGQQVGVTDNNRGVQGGTRSQTRTRGDASHIIAVDSNSITLEMPLDNPIYVANDAVIAHCQSAIYVKANGVEINFFGDAEVDVNGEGQNWDTLVPRVTGALGSEEVTFGCGITADKGVSELKVNNPIVRNALLHNINLWGVTDYIFTNTTSYNVHDKHILFIDSHRGQFLGQTILDTSQHEDGLCFYNGSDDVYVEYAEVKNCPRNGLLTKDSTKNIVIDELHSIGNGGDRIGDNGLVTIGTYLINKDGSGSGTALMIESNGSTPLSDVHINDLTIVKVAGTGVEVKGGASNIVIEHIDIQFAQEAFLTGGTADLTINGGTVSATTLFNVRSDSTLEVNNVAFSDYTEIGGTAHDGATLTLYNCSGV